MNLETLRCVLLEMIEGFNKDPYHRIALEECLELVDKEIQYRKKVNMLMGDGWNDLKLNDGIPADPDSQRICNECGKVMDSGYCIEDGKEYYCSDDCLYAWYSKEEYEQLCEEDLAYWTEWYE